MTREDRVQQVLTYLTFAEDWVINSEWSDDLPKELLQQLPLSYFNGAELRLDDEFEDLKSYPTELLEPYHPENQELLTMNLGPWQHCMLVFPNEEFPKQEKATALYHIAKFRKIPLSEVRGKLKFVTGDLVEWSKAWVYNNNTYSTDRAIFERRGVDWWFVGVPGHALPNFKGDEEMTRNIYKAKSWAFTRYYDWRVEIGFQMPGKTALPTIAMATDVAGARSAYRLRDIPDGKSRREALRHWVSSHWRKRVKDPDEEVRVWAHLRGVEEFSHNGLKCRIIPSDFDLKKAAEYQKQSKETPRQKRRVQHG